MTVTLSDPTIRTRLHDKNRFIWCKGIDDAQICGEEIVLLLLNDDDGRFARVPNVSLDYALAGGVLMDLALENRIDTDLEKLVLIDATPTGDTLLDPTLAEIVEGGGNDARYWVERTAVRSDAMREEVLKRLVDQGILERGEDRFLWVFKSRRYPMVDGEVQREVKLRIMGVLFSDEIPDPRGYCHHLFGRRLWDIQEHILVTRIRCRRSPYRAGSKVGSDWSGDDAGHTRYRTDVSVIAPTAHVLTSRLRTPTEHFLKVGEVFGECLTSDHRRLDPCPRFLVVELLGHLQIVGVFEFSKVSGEIAAG